GWGRVPVRAQARDLDGPRGGRRHRGPPRRRGHDAPVRPRGARAQRHRARPVAYAAPARRRPLRPQPRDRRVHPHRRGDERHRRGGDGAGSVVSAARLADPYRDTSVIDERAPRFNQAFIGVLSVIAVVTGWWPLLALLALQLAL